MNCLVALEFGKSLELKIKCGVLGLFPCLGSLGWFDRCPNDWVAVCQPFHHPNIDSNLATIRISRLQETLPPSLSSSAQNEAQKCKS